jgi:hypothetical protein
LGKKSSKSTTTTTPWQPAQGNILGAMNTVQGTVNGNQGNLDQIAGDIRGQLPGLAGRAFGDNAMLTAGNQFAMDTLGGKYLDEGNPYLQGMIDQTSGDVSDRVNSLFARSGARLGSQHAGVLTRELAGAQNNMRYGNYAQERQNQMGALGQLPALYGSQFAGVAPYLAAAQTAGQMPYAGLGALSPIIGLAGGAGQQTGKQPGGWGTDLLNAAASVGSAAIMASDERLKTNLVRIGDWDERGDGLGKYRWNWKSDPDGEPVTGVIASEVERLRPQAHVPNFHGEYAGVDYGKLAA